MRHRLRRSVPGTLVVLVLAALAWAPAARAAGDGKPEGALALMPADASFYSAMLRNKEQIDLILQSKAWAALRDMPGVKMGWQKVKDEYEKPGGQLAGLRDFFDNADNQELLDLLADAGSHEIFCCGGASWVPFLELWTLLNNARQYGPLIVLAEKGPEGANDPARLQGQLLLRTAAAHPELIQFPDFVVGFKLTDTKKATNQLRRLEILGGILANQVPNMKGRVKSVKVGDDSFLTVNLDGSMIPWDEIPLRDLEQKEGEFDGLVKKLKGLKLTVSLGVREDYLLLGVGSSVEAVAAVGGKGKRLTDVPELKPVLAAAAAGKRLTGIGYVSAALRADKEENNPFTFARQALQVADIPEAQKKKILRDLDGLSRELLKEIPTYGAEVSYVCLGGRGIESFQYDYTKGLDLDGSKPLTLLNHLGGNPLLAALGRGKASPDGYKSVVHWLKVLYGDAEDVLLGKLEKEQREVYEKYSREIFPLLNRLDEVTGTMLLPALADGQVGFVLDAKWKSKQWSKDMPPLPNAMPLPEPALVLGVSDAELLRKAMSGYRTLVNDTIAKARDLFPQLGIPDLQVPLPESKEGQGGSLYYYPLPEQWGVDSQVVPTAGLSKRVAVLTLSHAQAERILENKPLAAKGGPLADLKKPRASAAYLDWPALVDTFAPWVEMGLMVVPPQQLAPGAPDEQSARKAQMAILGQVRTVVRVLKVIRGSTSSTVHQDGAWVTHGETVIRDLDE